MAYLIHGHISYILEASSKRPNDFSLMGRKPNEISQFNPLLRNVVKWSDTL